MNDKNFLREKLKIKRKYFQNVRREVADSAIMQNFFNAYGNYNSFFVYNSFSTEADTKLIINELLSAGKRVYLPRVEGENIVAVPYGSLKKGAFGIEEPEGQAFKGDIEVTLIPLLAVNERGFRIGYGKGYYDRFLRDNPSTLKVGLGYAFQREQFKEDEWDIRLDAFLCERGIYYYGTD